MLVAPGRIHTISLDLQLLLRSMYTEKPVIDGPAVRYVPKHNLQTENVCICSPRSEVTCCSWMSPHNHSVSDQKAQFSPIGNMGCRQWWGKPAALRDRDLGKWNGRWLMGVNGPRVGRFEWLSRNGARRMAMPVSVPSICSGPSSTIATVFRVGWTKDRYEKTGVKKGSTGARLRRRLEKEESSTSTTTLRSSAEQN
jgi:hypothetical protein